MDDNYNQMGTDITTARETGMAQKKPGVKRSFYIWIRIYFAGSGRIPHMFDYCRSIAFERILPPHQTRVRPTDRGGTGYVDLTELSTPRKLSVMAISEGSEVAGQY